MNNTCTAVICLYCTHHSSKLDPPASFEDSRESPGFSSITIGNARSSTTYSSILPTSMSLTITILCAIW